jgi:predicted nucleotidyltransferase
LALEHFLASLRAADTESETLDLCRRQVLHGTPHVFLNREDDFYLFRKKIAEKFNVSFHEVYVVGSAKLGFSPFKKKDFDLDSDIDVAIASSRLFDGFMQRIHEYQMSLRESRESVNLREIGTYHKFLEYVAIGWIRPDQLPLSFKIGDLKSDWFDFFRSISNGRSEVGNYKVSAGVFRN